MPDEEERALERGRLKFVGGRFDGDGVHLEGLSELVHYQRLVLELAKDIWLEHNSTTMPTAIQRMFELRLTESRNGSFVATITREQSELSPDVEEIAELTDARVNRLFDRMTRGLYPDIPMSPSSVVAVRKFGITFKGSEALAIHPDSEDQRFYDQRTRTWLKSVLRPETMAITGTSLIGKVFALNTNDKSFKLELPDGTDVVGRYDTEFNWEDFRPVIDLPDSRTLIRLVCSYTARLTGEPLKIDDVEAVEVFSHEDDEWTDNLTELAALGHGWYGKDVGSRIEISAIEMARDILRSLPIGATPKPQAFPTVEGGVQLEWLSESAHTEITISPDIVLDAHHFDASSNVSRSAHPVGSGAAVEFLRGVGRA
jgi:hypothetical protein